MAKAIARGQIARGVVLCGSGVVASKREKKGFGVGHAPIHDVFSAHQGVGDDDVNVVCHGGNVIRPAIAWEQILKSLSAQFTGAEQHKRRLSKVQELDRLKAEQSTIIPVSPT